MIGPPHKQRVMIKVQPQERPLSMKNGKISVSNSLKACRQCERLGNEIIMMRK